MADTRPTPLDIARDACLERGYPVENLHAGDPEQRGTEFRVPSLGLLVTYPHAWLTMHSTSMAMSIACTVANPRTDAIRHLINLHLDLLEADLKHA